MKAASAWWEFGAGLAHTLMGQEKENSTRSGSGLQPSNSFSIYP